MANTLLGKTTLGDIGTGTFSDVYQVKLETPGDWASALTTTGIPRQGAVHPTKTTYEVRNVRAAQWREGHPDLAAVTVTYAPKTGCDLAERSTAPWDDAAEWEVQDQACEVYDGKYFDPATSTWIYNNNSAGDPFDPPQPRVRYTELLVITQKFQLSTVSPAALSAYRGKVNSDAVTILARSSTAGAYNFLIRGIRSRKAQWLDTSAAPAVLKPYIIVVWEIEYDPEGHAIAQLDIGYQYKATDGKLYPILETPEPGSTIAKRITRPYRLNG